MCAVHCTGVCDSSCVPQVTTYDRLRTGWFSVLVTSYPDKIHEALAASLAVLRELAVSPVTPRELMRAKRTLLTRCDYDCLKTPKEYFVLACVMLYRLLPPFSRLKSELKDYWLGMPTCTYVPH
jgi:hypothetical protein